MQVKCLGPVDIASQDFHKYVIEKAIDLIPMRLYNYFFVFVQ